MRPVLAASYIPVIDCQDNSEHNANDPARNVKHFSAVFPRYFGHRPGSRSRLILDAIAPAENREDGREDRGIGARAWSRTGKLQIAAKRRSVWTSRPRSRQNLELGPKAPKLKNLPTLLARLHTRVRQTPT